MADNETPSTPPAPFVPLSQVSPDDLMKAFVEDGVITPEQAATAPVGKPATPPPASPPPAKEEDVPALVKIAKANAELRKARETAGPHLEMLKVFSPQEAQRLAAARANGDPVAALAALGFTHSEYVNKLTNVKKDPEATEVPETTGDPEILTLKQKVASMEAERENARIQASRAEALGKMESTLKDNPKFNTINSLRDYAGIEKVLLQYWSENNALPADTFEESVILAAEVHEANLKKEAERWRPVLTPGSTPAVLPPKAPESPRPASESPRTLTNANTTAPAAARTSVPKTREEIVAALIRGDDLEATPG